MVREMPAGHGFADVVFLPLPMVQKPALIIELKYGGSADAAIQQIRDRQYPRVLGGDVSTLSIPIRSQPIPFASFSTTSLSSSTINMHILILHTPVYPVVPLYGRDLPVECVFLSSYAYFAYAQKAVNLKSSNYLLKPGQIPPARKIPPSHSAR